MGFSYTTNCGQYVLTEDGRPIGHLLDEVSLAFEPQGTLYKHGSPEMVSRWADAMKAKLRGSPAPHLADDLHVITGRFPLDELNKCLTHSGHVLKLFAAVNHLSTMMSAAGCTTDVTSPDVVYLRRLEQHVRASEDNAAAFRASVDEDFLEAFFYRLEEQPFVDFDHFDAVLARVVSLLGRTYAGADAVAGLEPKDYWSRVISMAAWKYDDKGNPMHLSETKPAFWAAWVERALESGMTADSEVVWEFAGFDRDSCTQDFRTSIAENAGEGCAAIFDAVVARRLMEASIQAPGGMRTTTVTPTPRRKLGI